jgi:nucleotide-binding universal stress UspA family protein
MATFLIDHILVAIDGSENSYRALEFALNLAEKFEASVVILNVFQIPMMASQAPGDPMSTSSAVSSSGSDAKFIDDLKKIHEEMVNRAIDKAKKIKPNVEISAELKEGDPALQIVETAKDENFDVIVIGHKGESRVREFFLGSNSEKVAHLSQCPVIIVK